MSERKVRDPMTRPETLLAFSIVLAGVFVTAGVAKFLDTSGSREAARAFGLPSDSRDESRALPLAEIAVAGAAPPRPPLVGGRRGAGALLSFCAAIALAMVRGKAPDCHCFGQLHSAPAGWNTLVRNGFLAAIAAFIVVAGRDDPGAGAFAWASALDSIEWLTLALAVTLAAVVAIGGYALAHVMRSYGRVLLRLEAIEERLRAAGFESTPETEGRDSCSSRDLPPRHPGCRPPKGVASRSVICFGPVALRFSCSRARPADHARRTCPRSRAGRRITAMSLRSPS